MDNKKNKIIKWWIIYGLIWGCIVIIISLLGEDKEISYMPIRIRYMQNMMDFFNGKSELWELRSHNASYYFYLAIFAKCFNIQSPEKVFLIVQTLAAGINVVFYPIIFYYLFEYNKWIAMFSPVFWLLCEGPCLVYLQADTYWSLAWTVSMALPLLFILIKRKWDGISNLLYLLILIIMSVGNLPRNHSSLAIFAITIAVVGWKLKKKELENSFLYGIRKGSIVLVGIIAYCMLVSVIPKCYMQITGQEGLVSNYGPWHTIYISYGFEDNPYGITFRDECAKEKVNEIMPGTEYLSEEYFEILKKECFRMWKENPIYFIGSYCRKMLICIKTVLAKKSNAISITVVVMIEVLKKIMGRKHIGLNHKQFFLMAIFAFLIEAVFPLIAIPSIVYLEGMLAAWGIILILLLCCSLEGLLCKRSM
ncbi:hypothetical protein D5282_05815 [bacterium 1xD8-48]|nr:hypothetical protein [bacterium 1xD8-48]